MMLNEAGVFGTSAAKIGVSLMFGSVNSLDLHLIQLAMFSFDPFSELIGVRENVLMTPYYL